MSALVSFILKCMIASGKKVASEIDEATTNPVLKQEELLKDILTHSVNTQIGRQYHLDKIKSVEQFQKEFPLTTYDFYGDRIAHMIKGDNNILTDREIVHFNITSGTLGVPKNIPVSQSHVDIFSKINAKYLNYLVAKELGSQWTKGKGFSLAEGTYHILTTKVTMGSASSLHSARMGRIIPFLSLDSADWMYTSPIEARQPKTTGIYTRYLHARFALEEENITYGNVTFSSYLLEIMRYIEKNWQMLCDDIERGTISDAVEIDDDVKTSVLRKIKPNPTRAQQLRAIFKEGCDKQIGRKIWPHIQFFICVGGANFQNYTDKLKERYFGEDFHILYLGLSCSEAMISVPIKLDSDEAVFLPTSCFYEFVEVEDGLPNYNKGIKLLHQLEIGKSYEIIVSNTSGLLRYQLNDVIEVVGMYNNTPTMKFVNRTGFGINMFGEKTSEKALQYTARAVAEKFKLDMNDYCVCPLQDENGGRYIFLYEIHNCPKNINKRAILEETERVLKQANPIYEEILEEKSCSTEVRYLQEETFMLYNDIMIMKGKAAAQIKPVHVTRNPFQQKFFLGLEDKEI